jgi:bifunctional non-homologous end joining protein LigD
LIIRGGAGCHGLIMAAGSLPLIRPMLATLGQLPEPPGWGYEFKWDGVRALIYLDAGRIRIASRNDRDVTGALKGAISRFKILVGRMSCSVAPRVE